MKFIVVDHSHFEVEMCLCYVEFWLKMVNLSFVTIFCEISVSLFTIEFIECFREAPL